MTFSSSKVHHPRDVLVVVGSGGMGMAIARRMGSGHHIVLADFSEKQLETSAELLRDEGQLVDTVQTDITSLDSVQNLVKHVSKLGPIQTIAHTAGLSPIQASPDRIYQVDLLGTAQIIDAFYPLLVQGTAMVVIASGAGHGKLSEISAGLERHLATAPTDQLLPHPELETSAGDTLEAKNSYQEGYRAYSISKRANIVRVQATASAWASKGARINTISPGVTATAMGRQEIEGPIGGAAVQRVIDQSPARRAGSPFEIANVVAFLSSPDANFITGNDIIVDGGWLASTKWTEVGINKE